MYERTRKDAFTGAKTTHFYPPSFFRLFPLFPRNEYTSPREMKRWSPHVILIIRATHDRKRITNSFYKDGTRHRDNQSSYFYKRPFTSRGRNILNTWFQRGLVSPYSVKVAPPKRRFDRDRPHTESSKRSRTIFALLVEITVKSAWMWVHKYTIRVPEFRNLRTEINGTSSVWCQVTIKAAIYLDWMQINVSS